MDMDPPIELHVELPCAEAREKSDVLKERLVNLLSTRFRPACPESAPRYGLTVEAVAELLHCRCETIFEMIKRGNLHPLSDEDGELHFDPAEIASVTHIRIGARLSRLVPTRP
jgi:hypothetical protein